MDNFVYKRRNQKQPIIQRITVPLSEQQKEQIEWLKSQMGVDINDAIRRFLDQTYFLAREGRLPVE